MYINKVNLTQLGKSLAQEDLVKYNAWLNATGVCLREHIVDQVRADEIFQNTLELYRQFSVSSNIIAFRHARLLEEMDSLNQTTTNSSSGVPKLLAHYLKTGQPPTIELRSSVLKELTTELMGKFYANVTTPPKQIVLVSTCSPTLPSGAQIYASNNQWTNTSILHSYFMGCYGSLPALKIAAGQLLGASHQLLAPKEEVDVIHAEFFSCYINLMETDPLNIINQTLFSEGVLKYTLSAVKTRGLQVLYIDETIIPNTADLMTWYPDEYGFGMYLSKEIPNQFVPVIPQFVTNLFAAINLNFNELKDKLVYAIHPGGSKILDGVAKALNLNEEQMMLSRQTLLLHGNTSSASLPIMWHSLIDDSTIHHGTYILCLNFGPGLTMMGCILKKEED